MLSLTTDNWEWLTGGQVPFGEPHLLMSGIAYWVKTKDTGEVFTFEIGSQ
jgi:hypothetical protein